MLKRAFVVVVVAALAACGTVVDTTLPAPPAGTDGGVDGSADTGTAVTDAELPDAAVDAPADADASTVDECDSSTCKTPTGGVGPGSICAGTSLFCEDFDRAPSPWTEYPGEERFKMIFAPATGNFAIAETSPKGMRQTVGLTTSAAVDISFRVRFPQLADIPFFWLEDPEKLGNTLSLIIDPNANLTLLATTDAMLTETRGVEILKPQQWHTLRLVADFGVNGFARLYLDNEQIGEPVPFSTPETAKPAMTIGVPVMTGTARLDLDDILVK